MPDPREYPIAPNDLAQVAEAYQLGDIHQAAYLTNGLMNRNWQITTATGTFALKQIIDVPLATARRNLGALTALSTHGIPACPPLLTGDGDAVLEIEDRGYCLLPWITGTHPAGPDLSLDQARELGATLGHIHDALQRPEPPTGLPPVATRPAARPIDREAALADAERYQAAARAAHNGPFDLEVIRLLDHRRALIEKYSDARPSDDHPRGPFGWTHGDLQHRNVIWRDGHIAAVIDWDRIRVRPYSEEIARTATIQFADEQRLDLSRVAAFVTGYRTVVPLEVADLADGVHRLWWKRLSDFWHLDFHYDRDDHGCDDLFLSGEAFLDWWTHNRDDVQDAFASSV